MYNHGTHNRWQLRDLQRRRISARARFQSAEAVEGENKAQGDAPRRSSCPISAHLGEYELDVPLVMYTVVTERGRSMPCSSMSLRSVGPTRRGDAGDEHDTSSMSASVAHSYIGVRPGWQK